VGCIAAHGLLGLNEQGLTVTRQAIPELDTLLRESAKAGSFDLQSHTRHQHDRVNQCDGLSQYAKSTQDAVRADQRHFDPFSRFKFDNERHDGCQRKMSPRNGLAKLDHRSPLQKLDGLEMRANGREAFLAHDLDDGFAG